MYLHSRFRTINSATARQAVAASVEAAAMASSITGHDISAWMTVGSREAGRINFSVMFEHLAELDEGIKKLGASAEYGEWVEAHDHLFVGTAEDVVLQILFGEPDPDREVNVVAGTRAVAANGKLGAAMAGGVELAEAFSKITGTPMLFGTTVTGLYGGVVWIGGAPGLGELEGMLASLNGDPSWVALVDQHGPSYAPGGETTWFQRLG